MTIGDLERCTGMSRANIRYYEQEGLLSPGRRENGYRDYSQEDLDTLLRVKLLRQLDFSLEEIRRLQRGETDFSEAMERHGEELLRESMALAGAREICREIGQTCASFQELPADTYLEKLSKDGRIAPRPIDRAEVYPWRRYFARVLDLAIVSLPVTALLILCFHMQIDDTAIRRFYDVFSAILGGLLLVAVEPLFLHYWGTTPGKWILGIRVERLDGGRLTLDQAYRRSWGVFMAGRGFCLPLASTVCAYLSYRKYTNWEPLSWEGESVLRFRHRHSGWTLLWLAIAIPLAVSNVLIERNTLHPSLLPPHQGELTVADFSENFNFYREEMGYETGPFWLDDEGVWYDAEKESYFNGTSDLDYDNSRPPLEIKTQDGLVRSVSIEYTIEGTDYISLETDFVMKPIYLALAAAQVGTDSEDIAALIDNLRDWRGGVDFSDQWQDVTVQYDVTVSGLAQEVSTIFPEEDIFREIPGVPNSITVSLLVTAAP